MANGRILGTEIINGGDGNDRLSKTKALNSLEIHGGNGDDSLEGGRGHDVLNGDSGVDTIYGETGHDDIHGGDGDDYIDGGYGDDFLYGDSGNDYLRGHGGNDKLYGGDGDDTLSGYYGYGDWMDGGDGNDTLIGDTLDTYYRYTQTDTFVLDLSDTGKDTVRNFNQGEDQIYISEADFSRITFSGNSITRNSDGEEVMVLEGFEGELTSEDFSHSLQDNTFRVGDGRAEDGWRSLLSIGGSATLVLGEDAAVLDGVRVSTPGGVHSNSDLEFRAETAAGQEFADKLEYYETSTQFAFGEGVSGGYSYEFGIKLKNGESVEEISHSLLITVYEHGAKIGVFSVAGDDSNGFIEGTSDDDTLRGDAGDNTIFGRSGYDTLYGGAGNDRLEAGSGNNRLYGDDGNDILNADKNYGGNNKLYGGAGDDTLTGGDQYTGGGSVKVGGNDILDGGDGSDTLWGGSGHDIFVLDLFDTGKDIIGDFEHTEHDPKYKIGDKDKIQVTTSSGAEQTLAELLENTGITIVSGHDGDGDTILSYGGKEVMVLEGVYRELTINDFHVVRGAVPAAETVPEIVPVETVPENVIVGTKGGDTLVGGGGDERLNGLAGDDVLNGLAGNDRLYGHAGDDVLNGGEGNDKLYGNVGDDVLNGGRGDDKLYGGNNVDRLYGGDGNDILRGNADNDVLYGGIGDDKLYGDNGIDELYGGDGNDILRGNADNDVLYGGIGDDKLYGGDGDDKLNGGAGDDTLTGGGGRDEFIVRANSGVSIITDFAQGEDKVHIDVAFADLQFFKGHYTSETKTRSNDGDALDLVISANGAVIAVLEDFSGEISINDFVFLIEGTASHDTLYGSDGNDIINGYDGQDRVSAGAGNDRIYGGDGDDVIFAGIGDDYLDGGNGNDFLHGQEHKDLFVLDLADKGKDTIENFEQGIDKISITYEHYYQITDKAGNINMVGNVIRNAEGEDVLVLKDFEGTLTHDDFKMALSIHANNPFGTVDENDEGADIDNLRFTFNDEINIDDLTLVGIFDGDKAVSDKLKIKDYADGTYGLKLKEGHSLDYEQRDYIYLSIEHDGERLGGGTLLIDVNNVVEAPVFVAGTAGDDLVDAETVADTVAVYTAAATSPTGQTVAYSLEGTDATLFEIDSSSAVTFAAETTLDLADNADGYSFTVVASAGGERSEQAVTLTIDAAETDSGIYGGAGNDILNGGDGNDILNGGADNDILNGGDGNDTLNGDGGRDTLNGDGGRDTLNGGDGVDTLNGGADNDILNGDGGRDILNGDGGRDILNGGADNDILNGGDGVDTLNGDGGRDTLNGDGGRDTLNGGDGVDTLNGGADNDILNGDGGRDILNGDGGRDILNGGADNDILNGGADNDILNGDGGRDILNGDGGRDILNGDGGRDILNGDGGRDILNGGADNDILNGGADNDILNGDGGRDILNGDGGRDILNGGADNDILNGGGGRDILNGGTDNDILNGGADNDILNGGDGVDTLNGDGGRDILNGGNGFDTLSGGDGVDTFILSLSDDGIDTVTDFQTADKIRIYTKTGDERTLVDLGIEIANGVARNPSESNDRNIMDMVISRNGNVLMVLEDLGGGNLDFATYFEVHQEVA